MYSKHSKFSLTFHITPYSKRLRNNSIMKFNGQSSKKYLNAIRQLTAVKEARPRGGLIEHKTRRGVNINRKIQSATGILTKPAGILRHSPSVHRNRRLKLQKLKEKKKRARPRTSKKLSQRKSSGRSRRARKRKAILAGPAKPTLWRAMRDLARDNEEEGEYRSGWE